MKYYGNNMKTNNNQQRSYEIPLKQWFYEQSLAMHKSYSAVVADYRRGYIKPHSIRRVNPRVIFVTP